MRDVRSTITQNVLMSLVRHDVGQDALDEARAVLETQLDKYDLSPRCTQLAMVDKSSMSVLTDYLNCKRIEGRSEKTLARYLYELSKMLAYFHKPLSDYTTADIRAYLDYREQHGTYRKRLSKTTLDGMRRIYSGFFAWITAERIIEWNPCLAVKPIKHKKAVRKPFTNIEIQKIREACQTLRDTAMIDWFLATGCRIAEVASARLTDIDWQTKTCVVTGKGDKEREVYFTDVTAMHISEYVSQRAGSSDALFQNSKGEPLTVAGIRSAIKRIGCRAGVARVIPHRFRHTFASILCTKMPLVEVSFLMGHEDVSTTQIYCHIDPTIIKANYNRVMAA